jgi:methionine synthase I (cobalamin-dependent)
VAYKDIRERLDRGEVIILDGATGTELQRRGAPMDPAAWCGAATLEHHQLLTEIHQDYIRAGSDVITANTFASSRLMLTGAGLGDRVQEINTRAVEAALKARDLSGCQHVAVAGSLSHMVPVAAGKDVVDPSKTPSDSAIEDAFNELAQCLKTAGVDHIMLEMMYHPGRIRLALKAALATGLPVWFGASARRGKKGEVLSFHHLDDLPFEVIAAEIPESGIDVAGIMHTGSDLIPSALEAIAKRFKGPLMAYPDSGYFAMPDWRFEEIVAPTDLKTFYKRWLISGVRLIGGCCGLTVAHIEAAVEARAEFAA